MHDLRKKALLESGKTVSRKARSSQGTPSISRTNSTAPSPRGSRVVSRNGSDDESEISESTQWSTHSIDELMSPDDVESNATDEAWAADLEDRIELICDRKRSSAQGREDTLVGFNLLLTRHCATKQLQHKIDDLLPAILKSVKSGQTPRETVLALKALALILVTEPSETVYDAVQDSIKTTIADGAHATAKTAAVRALSIATFYGGASLEETEEVMDLFLDIASTDGAVVDEADNADLVAAALEEWGFLATQLDDMEDATEPAMDTFVDQLTSSDVGVQIAAGENIALMYEKSSADADSDDDNDDDNAQPSGSDEEEGAATTTARPVQRYPVYRQTYQLMQTLRLLAKASSKQISKKDRKTLHLTFSDILHTVENPSRGPRYSTALDDEGRELGSRMKITVAGGGKMTIDKWWKLHRLNGLKRLLQAGFMVHYEHNQTVFDSLPVIVEDD